MVVLISAAAGPKKLTVSDHLPGDACPECGFLGEEPFTVQWYRDHEAAHLAAFPDLDQATRDRLRADVARAEWLKRWMDEGQGPS